MSDLLEIVFVSLGEGIAVGPHAVLVVVVVVIHFYPCLLALRCFGIASFIRPVSDVLIELEYAVYTGHRRVGMISGTLRTYILAPETFLLQKMISILR
jgi:hypothetical protein